MTYKFLLRKKGVIEVQFNWLFILIIGAVILMVFSGIIMKQKDSSENSRNVLVLNSLAAILSGSEASSGTVNVVRIPDSKIEFSCNRYSISGLSKQMDVMNSFSPKNFNGNQMIILSLDFSLPYRVTNAIYLTSPNYRYALIGSSETSRKVGKLFPNETLFSLSENLDDIDYLGEEKVRLVFFDNHIDDGTDVPLIYSRLSNDKVTALNVIGTSDTGKLEFFMKSGEKFVKLEESYYLTPESILGAIFSDDGEIYNCVMENIFKKLNIVSSIYLERTKLVMEEYQTEGHRCSNFAYSLYSLDALNRMVASSTSFTYPNILSLSEAYISLKSQNKEAQLQSCATIY